MTGKVECRYFQCKAYLALQQCTICIWDDQLVCSTLQHTTGGHKEGEASLLASKRQIMRTKHFLV